MRSIVFFLLVSCVFQLPAQDIPSSLEKAITALQNDGQFTHSIISMCVVETAGNKVVYEKNARVGMAPASVQKIITSASAFELLGSNFRYNTTATLDGYQRGVGFAAEIMIAGSGDPTLGSWRFVSTKNNAFFEQVLAGLREKNITNIRGNIFQADIEDPSQHIPRGWIWEDIGNYYGAGAGLLNWRENQYDVFIKSGDKVGQSASIVEVEPNPGYQFENLLTTEKKGSGDNAYIFPGLNSNLAQVSGTVPAGEKNFRISGAAVSPIDFFLRCFDDFLEKKEVKKNMSSGNSAPSSKTLITSYTSPPLDSINYWFLKKSVNLYGEAFVKTIALKNLKQFSTEAGLSLIKKMWAAKGIDSGSIKMLDGSGLSPANRITTSALVKVLQHAKSSIWFNSFYNALPEMNGIKMKDGYISGVRSYAGYVKSRTGVGYTFAFIVNNFDGSPSTAREKIWRILDILK